MDAYQRARSRRSPSGRGGVVDDYCSECGRPLWSVTLPHHGYLPKPIKRWRFELGYTHSPQFWVVFWPRKGLIDIRLIWWALIWYREG